MGGAAVKGGSRYTVPSGKVEAGSCKSFGSKDCASATDPLAAPAGTQCSNAVHEFEPLGTDPAYHSETDTSRRRFPSQDAMSPLSAVSRRRRRSDTALQLDALLAQALQKIDASLEQLQQGIAPQVEGLLNEARADLTIARSLGKEPRKVSQNVKDLGSLKGLSGKMSRTSTFTGTLNGTTGSDLAEQLCKASPADTADAAEQLWILETFTDVNIDMAKSHLADVQIQRVQRLKTRNSLPKRACTMKINRLQVQTVLENEEIQDMLDEADSLEFNALAFDELHGVSGKIISILGTHLLRNDHLDALRESSVVADASVFERKFHAFLSKLDGLYKPVGYHNAAHAASVMSMMSWILQAQELQSRTTPLDMLMCLAAAAMHDVGHPGVNNHFLVKTMAPEALRYNDQAVLENMHCALTFETMREDERADWFGLISDNVEGPFCVCAHLQQYARKGLIAMVLATDMALHAKHHGELELFGFTSKDEEEQEEGGGAIKTLDDHLFVLGCALHAADLGHPAKPTAVMKAWTKRVLDEFWCQGDEERRLGFEVIHMFDRQHGRSSVPKAQLGFFRFVVQPFFVTFAEKLPELRDACTNIEDNLHFWEAKDKEKATYEQLFPADGETPVVRLTTRSNRSRTCPSLGAAHIPIDDLDSDNSNDIPPVERVSTWKQEASHK